MKEENTYLSIRVPVWLKDYFAKIAEDEERTVSQVASIRLKKWVREEMKQQDNK